MTCGPAAFGHGWFPYPICLDFNIPLRHESPRQGSVRPGGELFKLSSKPMSGQLGECSSMQVMGLGTQLFCIQFEPHWSHDLANATLGRPLQGMSSPVRGIYLRAALSTVIFPHPQTAKFHLAALDIAVNGTAVGPYVAFFLRPPACYIGGLRKAAHQEFRARPRA